MWEGEGTFWREGDIVEGGGGDVVNEGEGTLWREGKE